MIKVRLSIEKIKKTGSFYTNCWFPDSFSIGKAELEVSAEVTGKTSSILDGIEMHEMLCSRKKIYEKFRTKNQEKNKKNNKDSKF